MGVIRALAASTLTLLITAATANAQTEGVFLADVVQVVGQPAGPAPTPRHTGVKALVKDLALDVVHLPSKENLFWVGVGGGTALAVHPADDYVNEALLNSPFADKFFKPGAVLGQLGTLLGTATTVYVVGRVRDQPKVSHILRGRLADFSTERLMRFLTSLGRDVEIVVKPSPRSRKKGRLRVAAA